eukprot:357794-Chlamydomonas_euryale.AAC.6
MYESVGVLRISIISRAARARGTVTRKYVHVNGSIDAGSHLPPDSSIVTSAAHAGPAAPRAHTHAPPRLHTPRAPPPPLPAPVENNAEHAPPEGDARAHGSADAAMHVARTA